MRTSRSSGIIRNVGCGMMDGRVCSFLSVFPFLHLLIDYECWRHVSGVAFLNAHPGTDMLTPKLPIGADMDATFLRCCRRIYEEALPVLYGQNVFQFYEKDELREFRSSEIGPIKGGCLFTLRRWERCTCKPKAGYLVELLQLIFLKLEVWLTRGR